MRRAVNACVALCEDRCIAPPGFILEDNIAFGLAEVQLAYLSERLIQFPMRENNLADFAEKKRIGYEPMRDRYSGLFNDTRIEFLARNAPGLIRRATHITENILEGWQTGPDTKRRIWRPVKQILSAQDIERISRVPIELSGDGVALTWSAMSPSFPPESKAASSQLRDALQHIYFKEYCDEFDLVVLASIPFITQDFMLPSRRKSFNYRRLESFLEQFGIRDIILDAPAELIIELRRRLGFIRFMDTYVQLSESQSSDTDLKFAAAMAAKAVRFDWNTLSKRRSNLFGLSPVELFELDDALNEVASSLTSAYDLESRGQPTRLFDANKRRAIISTGPPEAELVLFVALDEELDVLADQLEFNKSHLSPQATGKLGSVTVDVICPKAMGRVPAAVAMTDYLVRRQNAPKLILIVGLAGGFQENGTKVGHTICATEVIDLASRKVQDTEEGVEATRFRRKDFDLTGALRAVLASHGFDEEGWSADAWKKYDWPKDERPSLHFGPLASVDEVIASKPWRERMLAGNDKLLGVEMEAGGVCAAARGKVPCGMLRVVSDDADPSKADDQWRKRGMRGLANLLSRLPLEKVFEVL
jgi:nucleoside phosphorylase